MSNKTKKFMAQVLRKSKAPNSDRILFHGKFKPRVICIGTLFKNDKIDFTKNLSMSY